MKWFRALSDAWNSELHGVYLALVSALCTFLLYVLMCLGLAMLIFGAARADTLYRDGFEEPEAGLGPCEHPLVAPVGWELKQKPWTVAFSSPSGHRQATYPNGVGNPSPVPGYEFYPSTKFRKGQIVAIPFVAQPEQTVDITWDTAQSQFGYTQPRPAESMFIGISACPWDVRPHPNCSLSAAGGSLFHTTRTPSGPACKLDAGQTYYINVVMADPSDGLDPWEHTCSMTAANSAEGCDVQVRHSGY